MTDFGKVIEAAVAAKDIPGCVLVAKNRDGSFIYSKSFGTRSLKSGKQLPLTPSTMMWIASCTKLMTSVCAMQLVERGLTTLDEPVYKHIPELKNYPILKGFKEDGSPIEEPHTKPITLRLLLQHTSGLSYDSMHPLLFQWLAYHGRATASSGKLLERFDAPLLFEPGDSWMYGPSTDYAGLLIERITKQSLEDYMKQNLWEPLGIRDMTFSLEKRPDLKDRMADMAVRDHPSGPVRHEKDRLPYHDAAGKEFQDCMGGFGVYASAEEYIKVLHAVMVADTDEKILKKATVDEMFRPQMAPGGVEGLNLVLMNEVAQNAMGGVPKNVDKDWGLAGLVFKGDAPDGKKDGTMVWGGYPNLIWFIDRKTGLCGLYAGQVVPTGDAKCAALVARSQAGLYELLKQSQSKSSRL